jgi:hypothetical protein
MNCIKNMELISRKGMLQMEAREHGCFTEVGISGLHRLETEERDLFPIMARKQRDTTVACAERGHHGD